ncbi:riboflavin synthase [Verrucomicrobiota bacterium]
MFTGLIQKTGRLEKITTAHGAGSMTISCAWDDEPLAEGESVCVQGACVTVSRIGARGFDCDVLDETFAKTNLASNKTGALLNLERALRACDRIGGHFVTGHVDGVGEVVSVGSSGSDRVLSIECSDDMLKGIILKGSVACNGVSLTVTEVTSRLFKVNIIPFTWEHTALRELSAGQTINIETDMLGKYVRQCLGNNAEDPGLEMTDLRNAGFL